MYTKRVSIVIVLVSTVALLLIIYSFFDVLPLAKSILLSIVLTSIVTVVHVVLLYAIYVLQKVDKELQREAGSVRVMKKIVSKTTLLMVMVMVFTQQLFQHVLPHDNYTCLWIGLVIFCSTISSMVSSVLIFLQRINTKLQESQKNH